MIPDWHIPDNAWRPKINKRDKRVVTVTSSSSLMADFTMPVGVSGALCRRKSLSVLTPKKVLGSRC